MEELAASNEDLQRRLKTAEEELNETKKALEDCKLIYPHKSLDLTH